MTDSKSFSENELHKINKFTKIKKQVKKGRFLVANKSIPAYVVVACFGKNLVDLPDSNDNYTDQMKTYGIIWPFDEKNKIHIHPDDDTFRGNLVNEPYQEKKNGTIVIHHENVKYVEDWDNKRILLISTRMICKEEELLWFYGRDYCGQRDYYVYPPKDEWLRLEIRNHQIVSFENILTLPNWIGFVNNRYNKSDIENEIERVWYTQSKYRDYIEVDLFSTPQESKEMKTPYIPDIIDDDTSDN